MRNVFLLCVVFFLCVTFAGCASSNAIYVASAEDGGQLYFLRPVSWKLDNPVVQGLDLDLTLAMREGEYMQAPVMNYTLRMPVKQAGLGDEIAVRLSAGALVVGAGERQRLFKSLDGDSHIILRYSVKLEQDSLLALLESEAACMVQVEFPDGGTESLDSEEFSESIQNLRLLIL